MSEATSGPYTPAFLRRALELFEDQRGWLVVSDGTRDLCWVCAREGVRAHLRGFQAPAHATWLELRPDQEQKVAAARAQGADEREALRKAGVPPSQLDLAGRALLAQLPVDALFWDEPMADAGIGDPPFAERLLRRDLAVVGASAPLPTVLAEVRDRASKSAPNLKKLPTLAVSVVTTGEAAARKHLAALADPLERRVLERVLAKPGLHGDQLLQALACGDGRLVACLTRLVDAKVVQAERLPVDGRSRRQALAGEAAALEAAPDELTRRLWLAGAGEHLKEARAASRHLTRAGWLCTEQGRQNEAAELFARALGHDAEDLEALQGRVSSLWALTREEEAAQLAEPLARTYLALGLPGQARQVALRALESRETGALLELAVQAHVDLGDLRGAGKLLDGLTLQLRKEGRARDAERAAQRLADLRSQGEKRDKGPRRPGPAVTVSPASKLVALAASLLAPLLVGAFYWQRQELEGRRAYADAARAAGEHVARGEHELALSALPPTLPGSSELTRRMQDLRREAEALQRDAKARTRAEEVLAVTWKQDLPLALEQLRALQPLTPALRSALDGVISRAEAILQDAREERQQVSSASRTGDLQVPFDNARRFQEKYVNVPGELAQAQVWIEIDSEPSGAHVVWRGQPTTRRTPLRVEIPVVGERELRLELEGYEPLETKVRFAELQGPAPRFALKKKEAGQ